MRQERIAESVHIVSEAAKNKMFYKLITYADKSDTDDTDVMVARIRYGDVSGGIAGRGRYKRGSIMLFGSMLKE